MVETKNFAEEQVEFQSPSSHLLCWRSIFAGLLITIMSYMLLSALGAGVIGSAAESIVENNRSGGHLATASGLWLGLSGVISLFLGSYFAVRMSKSITPKVGVAHGFVLASAFFILLTFQVGSAIGSLSLGFRHLMAGLTYGAANVSSDSRVLDTVHTALGGTTLKTDPKIVAEGLIVRLLKGDVESAKAYYAYETGLSSEEVNARVTQLQTNFERASKEIKETTAGIIADTGWSFFVTFTVGLIAALFGGRIGAHSNVERPLASRKFMMAGNHGQILANERGGAMPYIFGWLLGVPVSILFLVYMLRSVF